MAPMRCRGGCGAAGALALRTKKTTTLSKRLRRHRSRRRTPQCGAGAEQTADELQLLPCPSSRGG